MTFLNPLYLLGLTAAAIPIVIHLLTRKRPRRRLGGRGRGRGAALFRLLLGPA